MIAFARARTKSLLCLLWPETIQSSHSQAINLGKSKSLIDKHNEQKKRFLELTRNGGIWFS
tara:strand:- start:67 stop:249 length:183 start_codon:yes stop_codon:yes gene_type:complete